MEKDDKQYELTDEELSFVSGGNPPYSERRYPAFGDLVPRDVTSREAKETETEALLRGGNDLARALQGKVPGVEIVQPD